MPGLLTQTNEAAFVPCREKSLFLADTCSFEPTELLTFPAVAPANLDAPVPVAANDAPLTVNKINTISNSAVKNVLYPAAPAEGDVFVVVNNTPQEVTIKTTVADTSPGARLRPATVATFRYVGGVWKLY